MGVIAGDNVVVIMDPAPVVYTKLFYGGSGPDRHLRKKAQAVALTAKVLAPRRTGALAASVKTSQNRDEKGGFAFGYQVSASTPYVVYVHEGTGPSPRWPDSRKVMKWTGREGAPVFRDFVMHPGTPAVPFLRNALLAELGG